MKKLIFALAVCATIASCQKKEDTDPIDVSKTVYLMDGSWHLKWATKQYNITDSITPPADNFTPRPGCEKDNSFVFRTRDRVYQFEGASKCNVGDPDSVVFGYTLSNNDKHLLIFTDPDLEDHSVKLEGDVTYRTIDTFILTYTKKDGLDSSVTSRFIETYVKQK